MTLTPEDLAEIEARVNSATEGPWQLAPDGYRIFDTATRIRQIGAVAWNNRGRTPSAQQNAVFIAHARQDVPALIAALREAWEKNEQLRESLKTFAAEETTQARRLRAGIVAARQKLERTRSTWSGPIHQADGILADALSAREVLK